MNRLYCLEKGEHIKTTIAEATVSFFEQQGITHCFGISGANIERFYDALSRSSIIPILAGHESMAGTMAIGAVKAGEPCGVVAVTSGGGSFNLIPSLAEAYSAQIPLFVIAGSPHQSEGNDGPFQRSDGLFNTPNLPAAFSSVSRWCRTLNSPEELNDLLAEGFREIMSGEKLQGPAVLIIPQNLFLQKVSSISVVPISPHFLPISVEPFAIVPPITLIIGAHAQRFADPEDLVSLANHLKAAVVVTADAKGSFPNDSVLYTGVVGTMGHRSAGNSIDRASTVIAIGTSLPQMDRFGHDSLAEKTIFTIGEPHLCGSLVGTYLGNNYAEAFKILVRSTPPLANTFLPIPGIEEVQFDTKNWYRDYAKVIQAALAPSDSVFIDAGSCGASMVHYLHVPAVTICDIALGMGGIGYSFGASIGATLVTNRRSWVLAGDGAFFMHGLEIHTAIELNLPITYIIFDNRSHGMCDLREQKLLGGSTAFNQYQTHFNGDSIQMLFSGVTSFQADSPTDLEKILQQTQTMDGVVFVSVSIPVDAPVPFHPLLNISK